MTYEQLWAPWRLEYILGLKDEPRPDPKDLDLLPGGDPACFICQCAADSDDHSRYIVHRSDHSITILNRYPYNNGHLLIAPTVHRARLDQLTGEEHADSAFEITRMVGLLEKVLQPQGFNIGLNLGRVAGAGLPDHLHWHVVPRWNGDTNFMPALTSVNVIPQSLDALWEALTRQLNKQLPGG